MYLNLSDLAWKDLALAGLWVGLAAATKYNTGLVLIAPVVAILLNRGTGADAKKLLPHLGVLCSWRTPIRHDQPQAAPRPDCVGWMLLTVMGTALQFGQILTPSSRPVPRTSQEHPKASAAFST